VFTELYICNHW